MLIVVLVSETKHLVGMDIEVSGLFILSLMTIPVSRHTASNSKHERAIPCVTYKQRLQLYAILSSHRESQSSQNHRSRVAGPFSVLGPL